ncbi:signal transduction histidine kinase [Nakamurella sp. UYEF19]|uniref:sensor histidine kinase n=1 Tax=Nakamurella sp. UYEF19 TaxID=1756392 RepID=UPI00339395BD
MTTARESRSPGRSPSATTSLRAAFLIAIQGLAGIVLLPLLIVSFALVVIWVGLPMLALTLSLLRGLAMSQRRLARRILGVKVPMPYRKIGGEGLLDRLQIRLTDPATYRDIAWLLLTICLGFAVGLVAMIFYIVLPLGVLASPVIIRTYLTVTSSVLRRSDTEVMEQRIGELATSRAETVDTQSAEIRRIERDLHDGAQARLVALSMNLGLAEQMMEKDPQMSRELLAESRQSASVALTDLRGLVRGIHPPVLADRGLVGGLQALALAAALEVDVDVVMVGRPPAPVESAVYFAVAEALTNAAKHSTARTAWIWLRHNAGRLSVTVGDSGVGGAVASPGGGLHGIERRLAAFDGTVTVASPIGGPTIIAMELPCELSSEKI